MKTNLSPFKYLLLIILLIGNHVFGQGTLMPLPAQTTTYSSSGHIRGYWFTAPTNFTITGLRAPNTNSNGTQDLMVINILDPVPAVWGVQSTNFTVLYQGSGITSNVIQNVNIPITAGMRIGILGMAGGVHSYGPNGPSPSTINGMPVTLTRFLSQNYVPGVGFTNYSTEPAFQIARVEMYYNACNVEDTVYAAICDNDKYLINNKEYTQPGWYIDSFKNGTCDSVVYTNLTVHPTYSNTVQDSIYEGNAYAYNNNLYYYSGNYDHKFPSVNGCDSAVRLKLKVIPLEYKILDTTICVYDVYEYRGKTYKTQGFHTDTFVLDDRHIVLRLQLHIRQRPNVKWNLVARDINDMCIGEKIQFVATGAERYEWYKKQEPLDLLYFEGKTLDAWVYDSLTNLYLRGFDDLGCFNDYHLDLKGKNCCQYFIPNAFSPNGDGFNDEYRVSGIQPKTFKMVVFNRVGQLVFITENIDVTWKGIDRSGNELASDVYYYHITGQCFDGTEINEKGDITLLR